MLLPFIGDESRVAERHHPRVHSEQGKMTTALNGRQQSVEDFLAWEREHPQRCERVSGIIRVMTGSTIDHNRIMLNVAEALWRRLRGGDCEAFVNDLKGRHACR
jgi:hypothetical protein